MVIGSGGQGPPWDCWDHVQSSSAPQRCSTPHRPLLTSAPHLSRDATSRSLPQFRLYTWNTDSASRRPEAGAMGIVKMSRLGSNARRRQEGSATPRAMASTMPTILRICDGSEQA